MLLEIPLFTIAHAAASHATNSLSRRHDLAVLLMSSKSCLRPRVVGRDKKPRLMGWIYSGDSHLRTLLYFCSYRKTILRPGARPKPVIPVSQPLRLYKPAVKRRYYAVCCYNATVHVSFLFSQFTVKRRALNVTSRSVPAIDAIEQSGF